MNPYWTTGDGRSVKLFLGDVRSSIQQLPKRSVQCVVTSPPYWALRDYGNDKSLEIGCEATPEEYIANMVAVFDSLKTVLRKDGTVWLNLGDTFSSNGNLVGIPWRVALALQASGWLLRMDHIWAKTNPMPESITNRCTKSHEYIFLLTLNQCYKYDNEAIKESPVSSPSNKIMKSGTGRKRYKDSSGACPSGSVNTSPGGRNKRSVWELASSGYPGAHSAVYPPALVEPCILAGSSEGDVVLDPFIGSGTTAEVCLRFGRECWGIDLNEKYLLENAIPRVINTILEDYNIEKRVGGFKGAETARVGKINSTLFGAD